MTGLWFRYGRLASRLHRALARAVPARLRRAVDLAMLRAAVRSRPPRRHQPPAPRPDPGPTEFTAPRLTVTWLAAGVFLCAVGAIGVMSSGLLGGPATVVLAPAPEPVLPLAQRRPAAPPPAPAVTMHVRYELAGPSRAALVSFAGAPPGLVQLARPVPLPWRTEFDASTGFIPTITAQSAGGGVSCRISVDGVVVSEVTSPGIATCTAAVIPGPPG